MNFWRVRCSKCGKTFAPLTKFIGLECYQTKSNELEKLVIEAWRSQSFAFAASHDDGENFIFVNFHNYFLLIPCNNFVCGSKRHLILSLWGK